MKNELDIFQQREKEHSKVCEELNQLYAIKNRKYNDSFNRTFDEYEALKQGGGGTVVCVRLDDKISRIKSILIGGQDGTLDESVRDSLVDLANYSIMAIMKLDSMSQSNSQSK